MSVADDGYTLFLKPIGMAQIGQTGQLQNAKLSLQDAAEYFWSIFIQRLRQTGTRRIAWDLMDS